MVLTNPTEGDDNMKKTRGPGRPSNYETKVAPRFDEIKQWRRDGQTEKI